MKGRTVIAALAAAFGLAAPAFAQQDGCAGTRAAGAARLNVQVNGVAPAVGEVAITVYPDDRRRFMAPGGKLLRERVKTQGSSVRACFWLPPGSYAVAVYHDANGDRDFNRTAVGLPAEGFGFSNDPQTRTGLPPLDRVRFTVPAAGRSLAIQMRYLR